MIKKYSEFCNEELNIKKTIAGGLLAATLATSCVDKVTPSYDGIEVVNNVNFKEFDIRTPSFSDPVSENFTCFISDSGVITTRWATQNGKQTNTHYTVTVDSKNSFIYYDNPTIGYLRADSKNLNDEYLDLSKLKVTKETKSYKILDCGSWTSINSILVTNGNSGDYSETFEMDGHKYSIVKNSSLWSTQYYIVKVL
jgi:hypothetical protein